MGCELRLPDSRIYEDSALMLSKSKYRHHARVLVPTRLPLPCQVCVQDNTSQRPVSTLAIQRLVCLMGRLGPSVPVNL